MNTRITHFSLIIDFLDVDFSSNLISDLLKKEVDNFLISNHVAIPDNWTLIFQATYNASSNLLVSKNKLGNNKSDFTKEIKIIIPIPYKEEKDWGSDKNKFVYEKEHYDNIINNFWVLETNYHTYTNRQDYIIDCLREAIKKAFQEGFTINGFKIKIKGF